MGSLLSRLSRVARNVPLACSVLALHVGRSRSKAASVVLRRSPPRVLNAVAASTVRRIRPDLAALALDAGGRGYEASEVLLSAIESLSGQTSHADLGARRHAVLARRLVHVAVILHDRALAQRALDALTRQPVTGNGAGAVDCVTAVPSMLITRSVLAAEQGHLDAAIAHVSGVDHAPARRLRRRLAGERQVLGGELWTAASKEPAAARRSPATGVVSSVLHIVSNALPEQQSGYTIRTHGIATAQRASGLDAQVVTRLGFPVDIGALAAPTRLVTEGVPYHRLLPVRGIPVPGKARQEVAVRELVTVVSGVQPDVLHAHSKHENAQIALIVGHQLGLPVIYEARGFLEETWVSAGGDYDTDLYRWNREVETRCMHDADMVVTLSTAMAENIIARGIDADRVRLVPNAVPSDFGGLDGCHRENHSRVGQRVRGRFAIPDGATVFGTVSTVNEYEGLDVVVEALALMRDQDVWFLIVGDGPARSALRERALTVGVADRVIFAGRVNHTHVRDYLGAMDVFVLPRKDTPVTRLVPPIKPLEAMAVGLPVLASNLPPLVEIVQPGRFGHVVAAHDVTSWAEQMTALRYAPHLKDLGVRAAAFVAAERTWTCAAQGYADVYAAAVSR